ncbi:MAG: aminoacetone oxidase family FAD-binding enzyme, partial [Candidatus Aminicenantes bacterium RBG_16_66_30]
AARRGASVTILERLPRAGKKLLATGGGRCNLLNERLDAAAFTATDPGLVRSILERFGAKEVRAFFEGLGLRLQTDESGRVYPATNQAASVLKVLEIEAARLGIGIETGFEADKIESAAGRFRIGAADGRRVEARGLVLAGGGRSYPALGSNGSGYDLAAAFGHHIIKPVPSAVPVLAKVRMCHFLQGQRMRVRIEARVGGRRTQAADGELLFTQYGLSGTAVLDVSESLSIALNREGRGDATVVVDLLPFLSEEEAAAELARRLAAGWAPKDLVSGLLPEKFAAFLPQLLAETEGGPGERTSAGSARRLAAKLKAMVFPVQGTRGWNEAEFTSGGVDACEVKRGTLESKFQRGLYLAGEVLDVQGGRGGFNLSWAWASGFVAGLAE